MARARHHASCRPRVGDRYVLEAHERGRLLARRRAVRPRHHERVRHDRRRPADRPAPDGRDGAAGQDARRARVDHDRVPAGARQRARRRPVARRTATRAWRMPWPRSRPSSATPAACCCARRAPRRWCASWSRPPTHDAAQAYADASPMVRQRLACGSDSHSEPSSAPRDRPQVSRAARSSSAAQMSRSSTPSRSAHGDTLDARRTSSSGHVAVCSRSQPRRRSRNVRSAGDAGEAPVARTRADGPAAGSTSPSEARGSTMR